MAKEWSVGEFLTERELISDQRDVDSFYSHLKREFECLSRYKHNRMGVERPGGPGSESVMACFFRGQACSEWGLTSSLFRLLDDTDNLDFNGEIGMSYAESCVILTARSSSVGIGRGISPLELLAILQHHGAPTRLVDLSTDWKVALYFACNELDSEDGRLFFVFVDQNLWKSSPLGSEEDVELDWSPYSEGDFDEGVWRSSVFPVLFPFFDVRMISQRGYFLIGGLPKDGEHLGVSCDGLDLEDIWRVSSLSIQFPKLKFRNRWSEVFQSVAGRSRASIVSLRIPAIFKPGIRKLLRADGVFQDSLFPPLMESVRLLRSSALTMQDVESLF